MAPRFQDLIDFCVTVEEEGSLMGKTGEVFRKTLTDYFFKDEVYQSKSMGAFFEKMELPAFLSNYPTIFDVDMEEFSGYVDNETANASLCGKIMLSTPYLKSFYPHQPPSFNQLSHEVRAEVLNRIKEMNRDIIGAFEKMKADVEADRNRKVLTLVAFIIKNVHARTEFPLNRLEKKAQEVIGDIFPSCNDLFTASPRQCQELTDEGRVKDLVKAFFAIRKFQDIAEITREYGSELERYRKRTLRARR